MDPSNKAHQVCSAATLDGSIATRRNQLAHQSGLCGVAPALLLPLRLENYKTPLGNGYTNRHNCAELGQPASYNVHPTHYNNFLSDSVESVTHLPSDAIPVDIKCTNHMLKINVNC